MPEDPPASLLEIQTWFASIITRPFREMDELYLPVYDESTLREIEERIPKTDSLSSGQRLALYHQQYWWRLFILLQEYYPTLLRLFGHRDFNVKIAEPYFLQYPPADWFLPNLANALPRWIQTVYEEEDRPFILQIAQIDEAYERLLHEASNPLISPATLALDMPLFLQPFTDLFCLSADFFAFREKILERDSAYWAENDFPEIDTERSKYFFLLYRLPTGIEYQELSEVQYRLLSAFKNGATLIQACASLEQDLKFSEEAEREIAGWFQQWADWNLFTDQTR